MFWLSDRTGRFEVWKLRWPNIYAEIVQLTEFTGGQIDEDVEAELFSSASLNFEGALSVAEDDIVRIYYVAEVDGVEERVVLFTGFASSPSYTASSKKSSGSLQLQSLLAALRDDCFAGAYQVPKNTNVISLASTIAAGVGLTVIAEASSALTTETKTFEHTATKLEIISWLCEFAGYDKPYCNEYGELVLSPKTGLDLNLAPVYTFQDDSRSIMLSDVEIEREGERVPNVVKVVFSAASKTLTATANNTSKTSPYSIANRGGRRVVHVMQVSDIEGISTAAQQAALDKLARSELKKLTDRAQVVTIQHAYIPDYSLHQVVGLNYESAKFSFVGKAVSRSIELGSAAMTTLRLKAGGE